MIEANEGDRFSITGQEHVLVYANGIPILVPMLPVTISKDVEAYGFDKASETLVIRFKENAIYAYDHRPASVFEALRTAPSKGSFVHKILTPAKHYRKLK